jgi:hypothetical protein
MALKAIIIQGINFWYDFESMQGVINCICTMYYKRATYQHIVKKRKIRLWRNLILVGLIALLLYYFISIPNARLLPASASVSHTTVSK